MKRFFNWQVMLGLVLLTLALVFYSVHYFFFRDARLIIRDFIEFTGLFFIQIMIATLVIDKLLSYREKRILLKKMNMAIGAFYSEAGAGLLKRFASFDPEAPAIAGRLVVTREWNAREFESVKQWLSGREFRIDVNNGDIDGLRDFLVSKRDFFLALLENPNLLEHEDFTDLLWAVFHLTEELSLRKDLGTIAAKDAEHLAGDIARAYSLSVREWLSYMKHLKSDYPYLFSLAMRTNPFDVKASVEVR